MKLSSFLFDCSKNRLLILCLIRCFLVNGLQSYVWLKIRLSYQRPYRKHMMCGFCKHLHFGILPQGMSKTASGMCVKTLMTWRRSIWLLFMLCRNSMYQYSLKAYFFFPLVLKLKSCHYIGKLISSVKYFARLPEVLRQNTQ